MAAASPAEAEQGAASEQARVSLDLKEAHAPDIVSLLARAADKQVVFDPGIACRLTINVKELPWRDALAAVLRACSLGVEEAGSVLRVAPLAKLTAEETSRRALSATQAEPQGRLETVRLSYARAAELAPLLQKLLPRGQVSYDGRTNTLIITY